MLISLSIILKQKETPQHIGFTYQESARSGGGLMARDERSQSVVNYSSYVTGYVVALKNKNEFDQIHGSRGGMVVFDPVNTNNWNDCPVGDGFSGSIYLSPVVIKLENSSLLKTSYLSNCNNYGAVYKIANIPKGQYDISISLPQGWMLVGYNRSGSEYNNDSSTINIYDGENTNWFYVAPK